MQTWVVISTADGNTDMKICFRMDWLSMMWISFWYRTLSSECAPFAREGLPGVVTQDLGKRHLEFSGN